jgi:hypothetical protein
MINFSQACGKIINAPDSGDFESRTPTDGAANATSTQSLPVPLPL